MNVLFGLAIGSLAAESVEIAFSPNGGATGLIVKTIRGAKTSGRVAAYSFTSKPIEIKECRWKT